MDASALEQALQRALDPAPTHPVPPRLREALQYAVFPGGARLRPRLCLAVAQAGPRPNESLAMAAAVACELLHCASLVHDDLPCFDDANVRRGQPTVHRMFGEPLALLAGDGLMMLALSALHREWPRAPTMVAPIACEMSEVAVRLVGGQAWESETSVEIGAYQREKTGALFEAAAVCGALASGGVPARFRALGQILGDAYQAADDIIDVVSSAERSDKSPGRDAVLSRPNRVLQDGLGVTQARLMRLLESARERAAFEEGSALATWFAALEDRLRPLTILRRQGFSGSGADFDSASAASVSDSAMRN